MKADSIPIVALSSSGMDKLKKRSDYVSALGEVPEVGPKDKRNTEDAFALTGRCERYRLSEKADRQAYAELSAKLYTGENCCLLWEERINTPDEGLVVYISYIDYMLVHHAPVGAVKLEEYI